MVVHNFRRKREFIVFLIPSGLVDSTGTMPKYPEVRTPSSMTSSKMLFLQSSSQLRQVALLSSEEM